MRQALRRTSKKTCPRVRIEDVRPRVDDGRHPAKRIAGRPCGIEATIFRDGHATLRAVVRFRSTEDSNPSEVPMTLVNPGLDLWRAEIPLERCGRYLFTIEAWTDAYGSWLADLRKRVDAGLEVRSEAVEGAVLLDAIRRRAKGEDRRAISEAAEILRAAAEDPRQALFVASDPGLLERVDRHQPREDCVVHEPEYEIVADRPRALFGAWYEMFPRSQGETPGRGATLREAQRRLPDVQRMGFDVLYLPPIHPIGRTKRKGRDNALVAGPDDPGSPWAIGNEHGGHDAVDPELGTIEDFDRFVEAARRHGLEIALDFAIQCSPDHPWVEDHPDWFHRRPDGTIKFAENPPKKYEDIYPINFDTEDREGLWNELRRVVEFWIGHGVKIFRVDNPHTKPLGFWEWLIRDVGSRHPEVILLSEAFTRPPMMKGLAKLGFTQSYTYFTWRNTKAELTEYLTDLAQTEMKEYFRPNFFTNTPDILTPILQTGGRPAFAMRLVLASTLSPSYGIYSGFELCESEAVPGREEYANSEKYEIKVRNWDAPGNLKDLIGKMNRIRRENPALQELTNVRFFPSEDDQILFYGKATADRSNVILVVVNLDPHRTCEGVVTVPPHEVGVAAGASFGVEDLLTGARYAWSERNFVRLDPQVAPAHVLRVEKRKP